MTGGSPATGVWVRDPALSPSLASSPISLPSSPLAAPSARAPSPQTVHPNVEFLVHPAFYQIAAKVNNAIAHAVQAAHSERSLAAPRAGGGAAEAIRRAASHQSSPAVGPCVPSHAPPRAPHSQRAPPPLPRAPCAATTSFTDWPLALVNPDVVAAALEDDYSSSTAASGTSYTLYLLNPRVAGAYAYSYDAE